MVPAFLVVDDNLGLVVKADGLPDPPFRVILVFDDSLGFAVVLRAAHKFEFRLINTMSE